MIENFAPWKVKFDIMPVINVMTMKNLQSISFLTN